ncbi:MAG: type II secretion system protein GspK [Phycisphaerae bacterium]
MLPVVLVLIGLLALAMAGFVFFVRAETSGMVAYADAQQARLAAESGYEEVIATLRVSKHDVGAWWDQPQRWRYGLVYSDAFDREGDPVKKLGSRKELEKHGQTPPAAWRFTVVADRLDGPEGALRFGITPESGKLNINVATDEQITQLLLPLLTELNIQNAPELIAALLDWRDADTDPREGGAENSYYNTLKPPYNAKNAPLDTIEELLLVKGFNAAILYGEDTNRNGILDPNEDDGDATPPIYDNADGVLNRGIAPFITVWARDVDTALDNKPRINLNGAAAYIQDQIGKQFAEGQLSDASIQFILSLKSQNFDFSQLGSPAELFASNEGAEEGQQIEQPPAGEELGGDKSGQQLLEGENGGSGETPNGSDGKKDDGGKDDPGGKGGPRMQQRQDEPKKDDPDRRDPPKDDKGGGGTQQQPGTRTPGDRGPTGTPRDQRQPPTGGTPGAPQLPPGVTLPPGVKLPPGVNLPPGVTLPPGVSPSTQPSGRPSGTPRQPRGGRGPGGQGGPDRSVLQTSPITPEEMPFIMDRFSVRPVQQANAPILGLININTAPARVLALIPDITPEAVAAIVDSRTRLTPESLQTTAWPLASGAVPPGVFKRIAPWITTKSYQFHVETIGYADHVKAMRRFEWIVEMIGPMPQVKYYRDLTSLGRGWPIDSESVVVTGN